MGRKKNDAMTAFECFQQVIETVDAKFREILIG